MDLKDWIKSPLKKIKEKLFGKIDVGGFTVDDCIKKSRENTKRMYGDIIRRSIANKWDAETLDAELNRLYKSRKTQILTTYKNIMSAVRGYGRSLLSIGRKGRFYNVTVLDERTTHVCLKYVGMSWAKPYSAIPDKPPRIQVLIHRCRSYLEFRTKPPENNKTFIQQFNDGGDDLQLKLLKPERFKAYKDGKLKINSYADFEKAVLFTLEELKLK